MAHATNLSSVCTELLLTLSAALPPQTAPLFIQLAWGWLLCLGRPTVANLLRSIPDHFPRHWTTAYRFFSKTRWSIEDLFTALVRDVLDPLIPANWPWLIASDDTTNHKCGRHVAFAGKFRDAVRSTPGQDVFHWSHNWVVLSLLVPIPFLCARYLHIPIWARLYRKEADCSKDAPFRTRQQLTAEMMQRLREILPHRELRLVTDGQYPSEDLVNGLPVDTPYISRIRSNASLFQLPQPRPPHRRGPSPKKGAPLPKLKTIAQNAAFEKRYVRRYGRKELALLHSFVCLWYSVTGTKPIRVVIVRDPQEKQKDDFYFSTAPDTDPVRIVEDAAARWGIEELIRELKQSLGFEDVQSWSPAAVLRQAPLALILHAVTQVAYLQVHSTLDAQPSGKNPLQPPPSFHRILSALRFSMWQKRISAALGHDPKASKILRPLESALSANS